MKEIVYKTSAGGVIIKDGQVLTIHWQPPRSSVDFPKGGIEDGESLGEACIREVKEETGYLAKIIRPLGITKYEYDWIDGTHHKKTVHYFLLKIAEQTDTTPHREAHETFDNLWLGLDDAMKTLTRKNDRKILRKAIKATNKLSSNLY